ncbi:Uncharacterised protein [Legionella pneumophila]|nr:Uncharacterised protein [Legionella pneumophila]CZK08485.1 Uncharacterised protein [Legionella pneumophila]CZK08818.1 Uncharacterised protein [Legionella pneumophila]CZK11588.1 Uncharacterised protein [Legionella pneumophila]CZK32310.1 Uncharacterised protein [Legionella pneumophila]
MDIGEAITISNFRGEGKPSNQMKAISVDNYSLARDTYSPLRVSTLISSPV